MATLASGIRVEDGGVTLGKTFGARRLKALLYLTQHPELDRPDWMGQVVFQYGPSLIVRGAVHEAPQDIRVP